jgi:hypothetical protein
MFDDTNSRRLPQLSELCYPTASFFVLSLLALHASGEEIPHRLNKDAAICDYNDKERNMKPLMSDVGNII